MLLLLNFCQFLLYAEPKGVSKRLFNKVTEKQLLKPYKLTAMMNGKKLQLKDASSNIATVTIADVNLKNGVIHVIDAVFLPK